MAGQSGKGHSTKGKSKCKVGEICTSLAAKIKDLSLGEGGGVGDGSVGLKENGQERADLQVTSCLWALVLRIMSSPPLEPLFFFLHVVTLPTTCLAGHPSLRLTCVKP